MDKDLARLINDADQLFATTRDMVASLPEEKLVEFASEVHRYIESDDGNKVMIAIFAFAGLTTAMISAKELKNDEAGDI